MKNTGGNMIHNIPETLFCLVGDFYAYKNEQHVQQEGFCQISKYFVWVKMNWLIAVEWLERRVRMSSIFYSNPSP